MTESAAYRDVLVPLEEDNAPAFVAGCEIFPVLRELHCADDVLENHRCKANVRAYRQYVGSAKWRARNRGAGFGAIRAGYACGWS